jgi:hypothetical protein
MGWLKSQNSIKITLPAEGTLLNFLVLGDCVFPLYGLTFACRVHSGAPMFHCRWQSTAGKPFFHDIAAKIACTFRACPLVKAVSICICICKLFWHVCCTNFMIPRSLWMMEYADPQLVPNFSAISVAVIHLSSWTIVLTHSTLSTIHEVVRWPKWSSWTMLILSCWNLSTHWYTFLLSDKLPRFYMQIALTFWIPFVYHSGEHAAVSLCDECIICFVY